MKVIGASEFKARCLAHSDDGEAVPQETLRGTVNISGDIEEPVTAAGGRIALQRPLRAWITRAVAPPLGRVAEITSNIAADIADLSDWDHRDPADRLIVATARVYGARLLTNDERIRSSELVEVV